MQTNKSSHFNRNFCLFINLQHRTVLSITRSFNIALLIKYRRFATSFYHIDQICTFLWNTSFTFSIGGCIKNSLDVYIYIFLMEFDSLALHFF